jgi:hypothetical protein
MYVLSVAMTEPGKSAAIAARSGSAAAAIIAPALFSTPRLVSWAWYRRLMVVVSS